MRKHGLFAVLWLNICLGLSAQTQQGFVKTLGRPNQQGRALSGVSVRVKGGHNAVLSGQDGTFAMPMPDKKLGDAYALQQVQKQGYELKDKGTVGRSYAYSDKVPLTLVMVSSAQLSDDKQRIGNKAYEVAEREYKKRLAVLEQQRDSKAITIEQYRQQLSDLQNKFEKYQSLIDGLAEHYALVDYDKLNDKEREINLCLENGELERADSLLQLFGVQQRANEISERLKKGERLVEEAQQEMAEVLKRQEKDAEYLYQLYTIALGRFDNEKARFYIETRAELDTTNVEWQLEAGQFLSDFLADYEKAMLLSERGLRCAKSLYGETSEQAALAYYDIGGIYEEQKNLIQALESFQKSLDIRKQLYTNDHLLIAKSYAALGSVYVLQGDYEKGMDYNDKAFEIRKKVLNPIHEDIAEIYYTFAYIQIQFGDYAEAVEYNKLSADILIQLHGENYNHVADCYHNMGSIYLMMNDMEQAKKYIQKAYEIRKLLFGEQHPAVAESLNALGKMCLQKGDYDGALVYFQQALAIRQLVFDDASPVVATSYVNVGTVYSNKGDFAKGLEYFSQALEINKKVLNASQPDLGGNYLNMAICYFSMADYEKAMEHLKLAESEYESIKSGGYDELALCYHLMGETYNAEGNLQEAANSYILAETVYESLYGKENLKTASENVNTGYMYYKMEDYPTAIAFFIIALDAYTKTKDSRGEDIQQAAALINLSYQKHLEKHPNDRKMQKEYQEFLDAMK
jgi:tetratricopeptide (TPR) repeat protein